MKFSKIDEFQSDVCWDILVKKNNNNTNNNLLVHKSEDQSR